MEKKFLITLILTSVFLSISIIFFIFLNNSNLSPASEMNLETCNILAKNTNGKFNLVFFSPEEKAKNYMGFFLQTSPFDKNKEAFNFYYIDDYQPKCELYKGIALLCHSKELIKKAASCPSDYIIVLEDKSSEIRSSSYQNVLSLNTNHPRSVLTHEFGHAFANLAEEYVPAKIPRGSKNCQSSCNKFERETNGCFQECSEFNYYRSIDNGIMRTLSSNTYGIFNENLILDEINKIPSLKFTGKAISNDNSCENQNYYLIEGKYQNNEIEIIGKSLEKGCIGENGAGIFNYNIIKKDGSVIAGNNFNPELIFTDAPSDNVEEEGIIEGETFESDINFLLRVPIIEDSQILEINEADNNLARVNLFDLGARPCKK